MLESMKYVCDIKEIDKVQILIKRYKISAVCVCVHNYGKSQHFPMTTNLQ